MFTRKHYEKVAKIIREDREKYVDDYHNRELAESFADMFEQGKNFKRDKFMQVCGFEDMQYNGWYLDGRDQYSIDNVVEWAYQVSNRISVRKKT